MKSEQLSWLLNNRYTFPEVEMLRQNVFHAFNNIFNEEQMELIVGKHMVYDVLGYLSDPCVEYTFPQPPLINGSPGGNYISKDILINMRYLKDAGFLTDKPFYVKVENQSYLAYIEKGNLIIDPILRDDTSPTITEFKITRGDDTTVHRSNPNGTPVNSICYNDDGLSFINTVVKKVDPKYINGNNVSNIFKQMLLDIAADQGFVKTSKDLLEYKYVKDVVITDEEGFLETIDNRIGTISSHDGSNFKITLHKFPGVVITPQMKPKSCGVYGDLYLSYNSFNFVVVSKFVVNEYDHEYKVDSSSNPYILHELVEFATLLNSDWGLVPVATENK